MTFSNMHINCTYKLPDCISPFGVLVYRSLVWGQFNKQGLGNPNYVCMPFMKSVDLLV